MKRKMRGAAAALALCLLLTACKGASAPDSEDKTRNEDDRSGYLTIADHEPETTDPQSTSEDYMVALNVFDRLVEMRTDGSGSARIVPSLAESWEITDEGYVYTFRLREGVTFSNGEPLTASDVRYTMTRLLTNPESVHKELLSCVFGAEALQNGTVSTLAGFNVHDDLEFSIVLTAPCAAFLARLSTPALSILDEETTESAGEKFGRTAEDTVGTGPFVFRKWDAGSELVFAANPDCWSGAPKCGGVTVKLVPDGDLQSVMFEDGTLDILDLDNMGSEAEFFIRGDIYQSQLQRGSRVGICYIALNESVEPLNDVRVRKALQLALDRKTLLTAALSDRGEVENGIFPRGLTGYDPTLPEIPYDPQEALRLLEEAGYAEGFDLKFSISSDAGQVKTDLAPLLAYMWQQIGVRVEIEELDDAIFAQRRRSGALMCYYGRWSADYNDPENFIDTFFADASVSRSRSLCYDNEEVMERVCASHRITDSETRLREYQRLQRTIVQEDAAWIPLFSQQHYFAVNERVDGFRVAWNGWSSVCYRDVSVSE